MGTFLQKAVAAERERRGAGTDKYRVLIRKMLSPLQLDVIDNPHRFKVACCGRRAGKSYLLAAYFILECLSAPNTPCLYIGLTRDSSKEAVWPILLGILEGLNIPHIARPSALAIQFQNGSTITLFGGDTPNAKNRLRGRKFRLICADETGFYTTLDGLIHAVLPMLADLRGTLVMTSSPGEILSGLFYEAYEGAQKASWRQFRWTLADNPHFMGPAVDPKYTSRAEEELDTICRLQFGGNRRHPAFVREYLGVYVRDDTALIYPYQPHNLIDAPKPLPRAMYALGMDLGVASNSAIVAIQYSAYSREAQIVESWSDKGVLVDELAARLRYFQDTYNPSIIVADSGGLGAAYVQELRRRYQIPIKAADKMDKAAYQAIFRNDLISGYIKIVKGLKILDEFDKICKDADGDEIRGQENHEADAALYVYRSVYNSHLKYFAPALTDEEKMEKQLLDRVRDAQDDEPEYDDV